MVVVGNLLLDFDYSLMSSVWKVPDQPFRNLALGTMKKRVGPLNKLGCDHTLDSLESYLAEAFVESLERPIHEAQFEKEEIQAGRNTASDLASREFLSLHHPVGSVKPMKSLKISADVFIHHIHFRFEDQEVDVSVRADKGIIKDLQTESPKKTKIRKLLIGTQFSD